MSNQSVNITPYTPNDLLNYSKTKPLTLIVIDFNATWCAPCNQIKPFIGYLQENYPNVEFYEVDIEDDERTELITKFNIKKVPTFLYYKDGAICNTHIGINKEQLEEYVNEYI